jgi:hypothetical protein
LYLIEGAFSDIVRYASAAVDPRADWIIKIAHLLCEPLGSGRVFTHTTGTPEDWYTSDRTPSWREVVPGDLLLPGIYQFETTHPIGLSKISERQSHSVTASESVSNSSTFRTQLNERDGGCVLTRQLFPLAASHLIPMRIGSDGARETVERFAGVAEATGINQFDPRVGIMLFKGVDHWIDVYDAAFYHIANDTYTLHNFNPNFPGASVFGTGTNTLGSNMPPLHGFQVALSVRAGVHPLPPPGVFNWHYLQCVIKRFGTLQYRNIPDIIFCLSLQNSFRVRWSE